ncbi:MAG: MBOAT family protein [Flavobacteriales bacterium]|nr:MBOAT family protein [Flavobacteriales bacterium]
MLFNSIDFAVFLPIVFALYWALARWRRRQNLLILAASYVFYGWWDPRFLLLVVASSAIDYLVGRRLGGEQRNGRRKLLLWVSMTANLGMLGFFKYFNFFTANVEQAFSFLGSPLDLPELDIVLPVGISFYTFQTMSYTIDVYRRRLEPCRDPIAFLAYVSFFPQLVAGPIERAVNLLPQFEHNRRFERHAAVDGLRQMLWGLFKKIVVADNCAVYANPIFDDPTAHTGSTLLIGALFFTFQIYCDFSGYSDIALGCSRLFGFSLMRNFNLPYFSRDIAEFWRRWHISLSTWFRDYVYIPLGGSRGGRWSAVRNTFIIFLLSGLWHGANWTFLCWGALNAIYFLPLLLAGRNRRHLDTIAEGRWLPSAREALAMASTFLLTVLGWIFFRAETVSMAVQHLKGIFSASLFTLPTVRPTDVLLLLCAFILVEWVARTHHHALELVANWRWRWARWCVYYGLMAAIVAFGGKEQAFIYFQF